MRSWPWLLSFSVLLAGCAKHSDPPPVHAELVIRDLEPAERIDRQVFQTQIRGLLAAGNYARLTQIADSLRSTRARFEDDHYALLEMLDAFSPTDTRQEANAAAWHASINQLEDWCKSSPASALPGVALAETYVNLAWAARGHGNASTVADTAWAGYGSAMSRASEALHAAFARQPLRIEWYLVAGRVALGQGWPTRASEELFRRAVALDSTCDFAYWQRADYLLPRWYGQQGEWEAWLDRAVAPLPPDQADRVYAAVCLRMGEYHTNLYQETRVSWPRVLRGFHVQLALHPNSQLLPQEFSFHAALSGDMNAAREMFRRTGPHCDLDVWHNQLFFKEFYTAALPPSPGVRAASAN